MEFPSYRTALLQLKIDIVFHIFFNPINHGKTFVRWYTNVNLTANDTPISFFKNGIISNSMFDSKSFLYAAFDIEPEISFFH